MANRIKGLTIAINGDTVGLNTALSKTNTQIKNTTNDLRDVERLLKLDPTNTELLNQKQKLLSSAVGDTKDKLNQLQNAEKQVQTQFEQGKVSEAQVDALKREIVATKDSLKDLETQARNSNTALSQVSTAAEKIASSAGSISQKTAGMSTAAAGGIVAIAGMAYASVTGADDLNTLAKQSGFTTEELQKMQYAADLVDVPVDTITGAATKMRKSMVSTSADTVDAWAKIGVSVTDASGNLRDSNTVFYEALKGLSGVSNETERDTLAMQLFGKSADQLAGVIDDGGAALKEYGDQAKDAGLIMEQDTVDGLNQVNDKIDELKAKSAATIAKEGAVAMEALLPVFEQVATAIGNVLQCVGSLDGGQIKLILTILAVVAAISPIAGLISGIATVVAFVSGTVIPALSAAMTFLAANPIVLVIAAIVAVIAAIALFGDQIQTVLGNVDAFLQNIFAVDFQNIFGPVLGSYLNAFMANVKNIWDSIVQVFNGVIDIVRGVFTGNWARAWQGVQEVFAGIFNGLLAIAKAPLNGIIGLLNMAIGAINSLINGFNGIGFTMPKWLGGGSWYPSIPNIPNIPYLATGGTFTAGSAIVGEAGPELITLSGGAAKVTPLSGGNSTGGGINFTANFYGNYNRSDGMAAVRDLNRQLGRLSLT